MIHFPVDRYANDHLRALAIKKLKEDDNVVAVTDDPRENVDDWFSVLYVHYEDGDVVATAFFPERLREAAYDHWDMALAEATVDVLVNNDGTYRLGEEWYGRRPWQCARA